MVIHAELVFKQFWMGVFMRLRKYWLDYDVAALAFLIVGLVAVEALVIILL